MATVKKLTEKQRRGHRALIVGLGGPTAVARLIKQRLDVVMTSNAVSNWQKRGIPSDWRPCLEAAAREQDVRVPERFIDAGKPPAPKAAEVPFL